MQQDVKIYPITHLYDVCHLHTPTELRGKRKIPNFIHFKGFPFMTEHIFHPQLINKQITGKKKTKKQINKLRDTLGRK